MASRFDGAEILASLWTLGAGDERLPTSHGILDIALKECLDELPEVLKDGLSFGVTGVGLRCYELPDILLAAQEALLTTEPNPTYLSTTITLDEKSARQLVLSHGIKPADARAIGGRLHGAIQRALAKRSSEETQPVAA